MHSLLKLLGNSVAGLGIFAFVGAAYAVQGNSNARSAYNVRASSLTNSAQRMPTMPSLPVNSVGNLSPNVPTVDGGDGGSPMEPVDPEKPEQECPDGGVKNSSYTVDNCMNDILACINNGALAKGLNDLFNEDLRNSILNGMSLCQTQVDRCIAEVRKDCKNVYSSSASVWIDFNARKVQPEYYNFVLRKTGLTPNQAENTCLLLDRNTFGTSFNAVSADGTVTSEYNNAVNAYNDQGGAIAKNNPLGVNVNSGSGVDGQRGHYARWDATTAECLVRVGAYNKDKQITNSWLFGGAGDDRVAEVWKSAGSSFTCNKDLFGFSLMNDTNTVAVVGVTGGTLLGAGIGAGVGAANQSFDCSKAAHRKDLAAAIRDGNYVGILNEYLGLASEDKIEIIGDTITQSQCTSIVDLYSKYDEIKSRLKTCNTASLTASDVEVIIRQKVLYTVECDDSDSCTVSNVPGCTSGQDLTQCANSLLSNAGALSQVIGNDTNACSFKPLNKGLTSEGDGGILCNGGSDDCIDAAEMKRQISRLDSVFSNMADVLNMKRYNIGKTTGIGAAVGAGAGGLATAITAFVERGNINCRVGDGLDQVSYGKSYSIGSLKDFYVKWNLNLPDTIAPTAKVKDCSSWERVCASLKDLNQCNAAQINYETESGSIILMNNPCIASGSECIQNRANENFNTLCATEE